MIMQGLQSIVDFVMQYAVTLAALSVLTVALIEAYKKVFSILPKFHQSAVQRWLQEDDKPPSGSDSVVMPDIKLKGHYGCTPATRAEKAPSGPPYEWRSAYDELLHPTTGLKLGSFKPELPKDNAGFTRNISFALFELELARMMAQVQEAADACVNNPSVTNICSDSDARLRLQKRPQALARRVRWHARQAGIADAE